MIKTHKPVFTDKPYDIEDREPKINTGIFFLSEDGVVRFGIKTRSGKYRAGFTHHKPMYWWYSKGIAISKFFPKLDKY